MQIDLKNLIQLDILNLSNIWSKVKGILALILNCFKLVKDMLAQIHCNSTSMLKTFVCVCVCVGFGVLHVYTVTYIEEENHMHVNDVCM